MTLLSPNHNYAADECIAQIPLHHIPTANEKVRASESFDKTVLVAAHMAALHDAYIMEMATHPFTEVTIKPASPTSSVGGLKSSTLKQLKVGKVHRRRVLHGTLCVKTLCTKSHIGLMVVNVFEDEEGNALPIYLSNAMEGNGGSAQAQQLYPQDSKVAVKEPYLTRLPDGEIVLLVERTTDLVFLWVPDHVKENGTANTGSEENGVYENGRDAFTMEKGEDPDGFVNGGDHKNGEEEDSCSSTVNIGKSMGDVHKEAVLDEDVKSSGASRELKFEDMMDAKGGKNRIGNVNDGESNGKLQEDDTVEESNGKLQDDAVVEEGVKGGEDKEGVDMKGGEDKEGDMVGEKDEAVKVEEVSRELSLEDMLAMRNGEEDSGEVEKKDGGGLVVPKGEEAGGDAEEEDKSKKEEENAGEVNCVETKEIEKGGDEEVKLHEDGKEDNALNQGNYGDPYSGEMAASLRSKGNALFARGDYNKATSVYMQAAEKARVDGSKVEEVFCLSNRAEVWLRLCRNQAAFDDAEAALRILRECDGVNIGDLTMAKALFRKGRALMGLHKYEDAMNVLQEVLSKAPADRQLHEAAIKCRNHLQRVLKPGKRQRAAASRKKSASFKQQ